MAPFWPVALPMFTIRFRSEALSFGRRPALQLYPLDTEGTEHQQHDKQGDSMVVVKMNDK